MTMTLVNPERLRVVTKGFSCRPLGDPFPQDFATGERLVLLHFRGDELEYAVFARLRDVQSCTKEQPIPNPQYEVERDQFEASTEVTQS